MKQKIIYFIVPAILVLGIAAPPGFAQGLLGKRTIGFAIGWTIPGDDFVRDIYDPILGFGGGFNIPVHPHVDAVFSLAYAKAKGQYYYLIEGQPYDIHLEETAQGFLVGMNYHFTPDKKINPFVGIAAGLLKREGKAFYAGHKIFEDDDTDPVITLGGGLEADLSESLAICPNIGYRKEGSEDDFIAGIGLSLWFNESVFGNLSASYAFDDGNVAYSVGMGFGF